MLDANRYRYVLLIFTLLIVSCSDNSNSSAADSAVLEAENNVENTQTSSQPKASEETITTLDEDAVIELKVTELADNRVRLHGTTNLPSSTNLMLSVQERIEGGFHGQSKVSVSSNGAFESEVFGPAGGLKDGLYVAGVTMPIPSVQPDSVKAIIGRQGENLSGSLVEQGEIGVTLSTEKEFSIGGEQALQAQTQRAENAEKSIEDLKYKTSVLLEELIGFKGTSDFEFYGFAPGGPYHQWLTSVKALRDSIPQGANSPIPITLRIAPGDLMMLGMEYVSKKGDTEFTQQSLSELKKTIEYDNYLAAKN